MMKGAAATEHSNNAARPPVEGDGNGSGNEFNSNVTVVGNGIVNGKEKESVPVFPSIGVPASDSGDMNDFFKHR